MKALILPFLFTTLLFGCENKETNYSAPVVQGNSFKIETIGATIIFPKNYVEASFDGYKALLMAGDDSTNNWPDRFKFSSLPKGSHVYYNSNSLSEHILFINGGYIPFNKELAKEFIAVQHFKWTKTWEKMGISSERVETKYMESGTANIIKVRYYLIIGLNRAYITQYVITRNKRSFAFSVFNATEDDFQDYITAIKFY